MSQTLCKGSFTCDPPTLKGIPIYRGGSEAGGGQAQGHRVGRKYSWDSSPGHLNSKPTLFIAQNTSLLRSVLTCTAIGQGLLFSTSDFPPSQGTKRKREPHPQTDHRMLIARITLGYLLFSTRKKHLYICIYKHLYRYIHIHS